MEVKSGYKLTEVGVIPREWNLRTLGELFVFSGGHTASRAQLSNEGHCYLHYGDIHAATQTTVDTDADLQDIPRLDVPLGDISPKSLLEDGDVVFVDASEDDEGASKHVVVRNKRAVPFISGLHTIVAKASTDELSHEYRRYAFQSPEIRRQFQFYAVGTKVKGISKTNIPKLVLPVPSLPEQRAIVAALSDADALLGGLDWLIAKKRDLKEAAMQQLLTGKTRLPGFHGGWKVKRLGGVASIRNEKVMPSQVDPDTPCVELEHIGQGDGRLVAHSTARHSASSKYRFRAGDVLFGRLRPYLRKYWLANRDGICTTEVWPLMVDPQQAASGFLFAVVQSARFIEAASISYGTHMPRADWGVVRNFELRLPQVDEQTAIASVLSDEDAELSVLEAQRDKTRALKQAMMQELLTGRTRLA